MDWNCLVLDEILPRMKDNLYRDAEVFANLSTHIATISINILTRKGPETSIPIYHNISMKKTPF